MGALFGIFWGALDLEELAWVEEGRDQPPSPVCPSMVNQCGSLPGQNRSRNDELKVCKVGR